MEQVYEATVLGDASPDGIGVNCSPVTAVASWITCGPLREGQGARELSRSFCIRIAVVTTH